MRIKKISPTTPANGNIENQYGTSQTNAYSEEYSNTTFATKDVATTSANGLMSASDKSKLNSINNSVSIVQGVTSNIGTAYWANQMNYIVLGKIAFFYVVINLRTRNASAINEEAYFDLPFTIKNNWYFPLIKANYSTEQNIYLTGAGGTKRIYLTKNSNRDRYKVGELPTAGYIVDTQFFTLLE